MELKYSVNSVSEQAFQLNKNLLVSVAKQKFNLRLVFCLYLVTHFYYVYTEFILVRMPRHIATFTFLI